MEALQSGAGSKYLWGKGGGWTQAQVEHQAVPQSSFGVKVTLQILQMEPLYSPGVGYQHHPVVFHLRKMLGSLLEKLNAMEPSWGLVGRTGLVLMPGVPLFQTSQSTGSPAVGTGKFLLTFPFYWFLYWLIDQLALPAMELCAQLSYLVWPTLQKRECSKSIRTGLLWSVWSEHYKHLIFTFSIDASSNSGSCQSNWAGLW